MRVLHLVYSLKSSGGVESFLLHTFRARGKPDLKLEVCHFAPGDDLPPGEAEQLGITTWHCPMKDWNPLPFVGRFRKELERRGPYDVVHAHQSNFCAPVVWAARQAGVPVRLAHYHNLTAGHKNDLKRRVVEWALHRGVLSAATGIIALTYAGLQHWFPSRWNSDPRMSVIRYGINLSDFVGVDARDDVRREFGIPADAPLIGHVGRFNWQKNHARLIEAFAIIRAKAPATRLLLVGDGDLRPKVEEQVRALGLTDAVTFAGVRRDVPRVLSAMDVFYFPSIVEGFGKALLEAQAAGLPVVASRIPTSPEAIAPVFHEHLRPADDVAGMADAALALLERIRREPELRTAAREFAAKFTTEASIESMLAAWKYPGAVAPTDPFAHLMRPRTE